MNCHYKGCERIPDIPVKLAFQKSQDERLRDGGTIWLCQKHFETLKFMLDINERGGKNAIVESRQGISNEVHQKDRQVAED